MSARAASASSFAVSSAVAIADARLNTAETVLNVAIAELMKTASNPESDQHRLQLGIVKAALESVTEARKSFNIAAQRMSCLHFNSAVFHWCCNVVGFPLLFASDRASFRVESAASASQSSGSQWWYWNFQHFVWAENAYTGIICNHSGWTVNGLSRISEQALSGQLDLEEEENIDELAQHNPQVLSGMWYRVLIWDSFTFSSSLSCILRRLVSQFPASFVHADARSCLESGWDPKVGRRNFSKQVLFAQCQLAVRDRQKNADCRTRRFGRAWPFNACWTHLAWTVHWCWRHWYVLFDFFLGVFCWTHWVVFMTGASSISVCRITLADVSPQIERAYRSSSDDPPRCQSGSPRLWSFPQVRLEITAPLPQARSERWGFWDGISPRFTSLAVTMTSISSFVLFRQLLSLDFNYNYSVFLNRVALLCLILYRFYYFDFLITFCFLIFFNTDPSSSICNLCCLMFMMISKTNE